MKKHLLLCGLLCLTSLLYSQPKVYHVLPEPGPLKYQTVGIFGSLATNLDEKLMQSTADGLGIGIQQGDITYYKGTYREYNMQFGYERLRSNGVGRLSQQVWSHISYQYLFHLKEKANKWYLGPIANIFTEVRITPALSNNFLQWNSLGSLGIAARRYGSISWPKFMDGTTWYAAAQIPLVSYLNRPNYSLTFTGFDQVVLPVGWVNRLDLQVGLVLPVNKENNNPNRYRVTYGWMFFHHRDNEVQQVISARHQLTFSFLIRTK
ncbi:MAG: hypothetical protein AAGH79_17820 [Bacteroidota bacterium]